MKLALKLSGFNNYEKFLLVDWDKGLNSFPQFGKYDGKYWGLMFWDNLNSAVDYTLLLSEYKETALPIDIHGNRFAVTDLSLMFDLKTKPLKKCECGTDSVGGGIHSSYCPKSEE